MTQLASLAPQLLQVLPGERIVTDASCVAGYAVDDKQPSAVLKIESAKELSDILRFACSAGLSAIPTAGRTQLNIGMPPRGYDLALDVANMNRILAYDPQDLTLSVEPGVSFANSRLCLRDKGQFLPLASAFADRATLGGMVATSSDTPLRYGYGTVRDFLLGAEFVTGDGTIAKSGGRVVKNVTGYDLHKLLIGSLGTLGVITRLNFRTFPLPPKQQMYLASFRDGRQVLAFCSEIAKSQLQPRLLDVIDPGTTRLFAEGNRARLPGGSWLAIAEAAGQDAVVERHARDLQQMAQETGAAEFVSLDEDRRDETFVNLCEFSRTALERLPGAAILRIPALPSAMWDLVARSQKIAEKYRLEQAILIRAMSVLYVALASRGDDSAGVNLVKACGELVNTLSGSGVRYMIEWCPTKMKEEIGVWPAPGSESKIVERLKRVFDPSGTLAAGRFQGGI